MYHFFYFILFLLFSLCQAHTNQICTSTGGDSSSCGSAKFFLTTYHSCPSSGQTPGQLHIQTPVGDIQTFGFSSYCAMSGFNGPGPDSLPSSNTCSDELSNKCGNSNSDITCYYRPDSINMISAKGNEICMAGNTMSYQCAYYATINNAVTGNYIVWTTGTDVNLAPCTSSQNPGNKIPCDISENNKITIPLAIEGCGSPCNGSPPIPSGMDENSKLPWIATLNVNSCSAAYDGIQCSLSCPSGFSQSGSLYCDNGNWINSFICVDQNYLNYCHSGSDCSGNGITTDTYRQDGCDCTCNSNFIGSDCSIPAPSPPTNPPTESPTNPPTESPTISPSNSPTNNPTNYPTNNPTEYPTNSPSNSPTSSPSNNPTSNPSNNPSNNPTNSPSNNPSSKPIVSRSNDDDDADNLIYVYIFVPIGIVLCSCCIFIWFVLYSRGCGNNEEYVLDEVEEGEIDLGVYECSSEEEEGEEGESIYNLDRTEVLKIYTNTEI